MGLARHMGEMMEKDTLKDLLEWIEKNPKMQEGEAANLVAVADIKEEIQRRIDEPTEG